MIDGSIMDSMLVDCFAKYANDAEERPLPREETTPPVTKIYRAMEVSYSE